MTTPTATAFAIDAVHSSAEFSVKHMMIATARGRFGELQGQIHLNDEDPARSSVEATITAASIDTGVAMRDDDLRSANFLDTERYPVIQFRSTSVERINDDELRVTGDLTLKDITREVVLDVEIEGRGTGMTGQDIIGFTATTAINRKDFGLTYNAVLETGAVVVGDKVKIALHIEAGAAA